MLEQRGESLGSDIYVKSERTDPRLVAVPLFEVGISSNTNEFQKLLASYCLVRRETIC